MKNYSSRKSVSKKSAKRDEGKKYQWPQPGKPFLFWGPSHCCPSDAPVVDFINNKAAETD